MKRWFLILTLIMVLVGALPVMAQDGEVEIIGGEENPEAMRELLGYLAAPGMNEGIIKIYVGSLPEGDARNLPLPDGTTITGAIQSQYGNPPNNGVLYTQIFFSSGLSPQDLVGFYRDSMTEQNWIEVMSNPQYGFVPQLAESQQFCQQEGDSLFMSVTAQESQAEQTRVNIQYTWGNSFECEDHMGELGGIYMLLPALVSPEGVVIATSHNTPPLQGGGGGGGSNFALVSAFLRSELSAEAIIALYDPQLEAHDWTLAESLSIDGMAATTWTFTDQQGDLFGGILTIKSVPVGENLYYAELVIQRKPK
ncbi:MAG: hypothetical protein K8I82_25605 [Anaerolineae bacterium]|nr:hypothetical protein [Anaerolineae bacterium]